MADADIAAPFRTALAEERKTVRRLQSDLRVRDDEIAQLRAASRERDLEASASLAPIVIEQVEHKAGAPGYPVTMWSDWHWGEVVDPRQLNSCNAFTPAIAHARVKQLVNSSIGLLRDYAGLNPEYPGIWVCLGGDMISGSIHEELRDTNWTPGADQVVEITDVLAGALLRMADEFGVVNVPCVVGNHGRNSYKPRAKEMVRESMEWIVYKNLERHFKNDPRFTFYIPDGPDFFFTVYGHRFLLTHGDRLGTKGGDGFIGAIGPITRGSLKVATQQANIGRDFDTLVMGHWHMYTPRGDGSRVIVNGTLKGYDEYASNILRVPYSSPAQALWLVSPKHGIAAQWRVNCGNLVGVDQ